MWAYCKKKETKENMKEIEDSNSFSKNLLINFRISNSPINSIGFLINPQTIVNNNPLQNKIRNVYKRTAYKITKNMNKGLDFSKEDIIFCLS